MLIIPMLQFLYFSTVSFLSYLQFRNAVNSYGDRGISAAPKFPELARQAHALKLAIEDEILYPRQGNTTRDLRGLTRLIAHCRFR
jgi:hypothetical protein